MVRSPHILIGALALALFGWGCASILGIDDGLTRGDADASTDAGIAPDSASQDVRVDTSVGPCSAQKAFGAPVEVKELSSTSDDISARLALGELRVAFGSARDGGGDIYEATRAARTDPFSNVVGLPAINTPKSLESDPTLSEDGTLLVFTTDRLSGSVSTGLDLWTATRPSPMSPFGSPNPISAANSPQADNYGFLGPKSLYFSSNRAASFDLYRMDFVAGTASNLTSLATINTTAAEISPVVNADDTLLYFATARKGGGNNDYDIWSAVRPSPAAAWLPPSPVMELSTAADEVPSWLSADRCRLYLSSDQSGRYKIYVATRAP